MLDTEATNPKTSNTMPDSIGKTWPASWVNPWGGLLVVVILYLALAITFSQLLHFSRALDEGYHLEYITFIKQKGRLPISYEERAEITRADFPPLYQLLVSWLSTRVSVDGPPRFKFFWDSFRYQAIDHQADQVWSLETEDLQPPYLGQFLVWQIGRWVSIALSLTTVVVIFLTLQDIPPLSRQPWLPLAGAALLAFIPRYLILGSVLNDDNLLGLLAALYFWMLVKVINRPERWQPFALMGVLLGLSLTVKYTLIVVPLEIMMVCLVVARQREFGWSWLWPRLSLVGGLALLCSSWWFGWNIWFLNTVAEDGWFRGLLRPLLAGGTDTTLNRLSGLVSGGQVGLAELPEDTTVGPFSSWVRNIFLSFWGVNIAGATPGSPYIYFLIGVLLWVVLFGLWRYWKTDVASRQWLLLLSFHVALFFILPVIRFELTRRLSVAAQGRHILIPAATAIAALLVWGLAIAIPQRWQRPALILLVVAFMGWTGAHLYRLATATTPPPLPLRTIPQAADWLPQPLEAKFGEAIELASYAVEPQPQRGQLHLELAWRSLGYVNESYLLKVELIANDGQVVSHWIGYNGHGRLPTLAWEPGDAVFDRLLLPLPNLPAGDYGLQLQLLGRTGPLIVSDTGNQTHTNHRQNALPLTTITLTQPTLLPLRRSASLVDDSSTGSVQIEFDLWRTDGPVAGISNPSTSLPSTTLRTGRTSPQSPIPPIYRYPATISFITRPDTSLELLDPNGQAWPATVSANGLHTFVIGPRWPSGDYRARISLAQAAGATPQAMTEPLLTVENWWQRTFEAPEIAVPVEANFADQIRFLGYKLPQKQIKAGQSFPLTLYWQAPADKSPQADFIQFNHFLDGRGNLRGGYDRRPLEYYNTLLWAPGEVVIDGYAVPVEPDAPPGEYYLNVGYYLTVGESAVNLPLVVDGQMSEVSSVTIGPIEVVAP